MTGYITQEQIDAIWHEHLHRDSRARAVEAAAIQHYRDNLVAGVVLPEPYTEQVEEYSGIAVNKVVCTPLYTADQLRQAIADALAKLKQVAWRVEFTNGGFLLESKKPRNYLPGAGVKYVPLYELAAAPDPKEAS